MEFSTSDPTVCLFYQSILKKISDRKMWGQQKHSKACSRRFSTSGILRLVYQSIRTSKDLLLKKLQEVDIVSLRINVNKIRVRMREKTLNKNAKAIRTLTIGDPLSGQEVEQADTGQVGRASIYQPAQLKQPHNYIKTVKKLSNFFFIALPSWGSLAPSCRATPSHPLSHFLRLQAQ